ncbi:MAG: hypothetical protein ACRD4V_06655, partial [Candidatus Acidiferrales bacterium]
YSAPRKHTRRKVTLSRRTRRRFDFAASLVQFVSLAFVFTRGKSATKLPPKFPSRNLFAQ